MIKQIKRLLILLTLLTAATQTPLARADGGLAVRPYWTFRTDSPVTHVQTGDINGDGVLEVVALDGKFAYVLENDGNLAWRYEMGAAANALLVTDLDDDPQTDEIYIKRRGQDILLSNTHRPVWATGLGGPLVGELGVFVIDLDGDGRRDILRGFGYGVVVLDSETGEYLDPTVFIQQGARPAKSVWAGDMDGDGRPEIVPGPAGSYNVSVWEDNLEDLAWQTRLKDEVGLVQVGDVDGDGQAEVIALTTSWDLILLESDGQQGWQQPIPFTDQDTGPPASGQLILQDLNGDDRPEIVGLALGTVYAFSGDGQQIWQLPVGQPEESGLQSGLLDSPAGKLITCAVDSQSPAAILMTIPEQGAAYLLAPNGQRLVEYRSGETAYALACADLNADSQSEIIIGTETGVQVFGVSPQVERKELWHSSLGGWPVFPLHINDLNGDGLDEIVAAIGGGERILGLTAGGRVVWDIPFGAPPLALNIGDVDNDGQNEVAMGTWIGTDGGQIFLLDDNQPIWTVPVGLWVKDIAIWEGRGRKAESSSENWPQIIAGVKLLDNSKAALVLDNEGEEIWRRKFDSEVTAVSSSGLQALVGTKSGQVYRLTAEGDPAGEYSLGAEILSLEADLVATSSGQVYQLEGDTPTLVYDFGEPPTAVQLGDTLAAGFEEGRFSVVAGDEVLWEGTVEDEITSIASGDVNGDGEIEIAVGTESGQVHIFGLALDQPLLLTKPDLTETRTGYTYSVQVNDPEGEAVPVTLEIWDPSTGSWLSQPASSLAEDEDRGRLSWEVSAPFDIWDSGQESRFRFVYDDGGQHNISPEIPGPFNIPTPPWYLITASE